MASEISALGKKDKAESSASSENQKEYIKIDLLLDTKKPNSKNHFNWKASSKSASSSSSTTSSNSSIFFNDYFDTVSGASKVHSTKKFRDFSTGSSSKNLRTPKGLRNLCLYAVSNPEMLSADNFSVSQRGRKLTITFTHREISYKIESDEKGIISVPKGFFIKVSGKSAETPKEEDENSQNKQAGTAVKQDKKADSEQKNAPEKTQPAQSETDFQKDEPSDSLTAIFTGRLVANLTNEGIFTLKGKLKLTEKETPEEKKLELSNEKSGSEATAAPAENEAEKTEKAENSEKHTSSIRY